MAKVLFVHVTLLLIYLVYRGVFCEEISASESMQPYGKLTLRDLLNVLEQPGRQEEMRYVKRSDKYSDERVLENFLDQPYEKILADLGGMSPEEVLKNNPYLWQLFNEQMKNPPQTRFLSPRMGRNADPHNLPSLPPRFGKRTTVFTPRMG